jgi:photosystem II stability/assembly factor-like uncharacterized protein
MNWPYAWVVGDNGTILYSTDNGSTWSPVPSHTTSAIRGMSGSGQNGYWVIAVGDQGTVRESTDAEMTGWPLWCARAGRPACPLQ